MKRIILSAILMAFASGLYANPAEKNDTLSTSVVTGTRVSMLRDQVRSCQRSWQPGYRQQ